MKRAMIGMMLMMASVVALADNPQWYGFAGIGQARINQDKTNFWTGPEEQHDTAWNVGVGLQLNKVLALEAGYYDLGKYDDGQGSADLPAMPGFRPASHITGTADSHVKGVGLSAKVGWTFDNGLYPYVRLGELFDLSNYTAHYNDTVFGQYDVSHKGDTTPRTMWGVGVSYKYVTLDFLQVKGVELREETDVMQVTIGLRVPFGH